VNVISLRRHRGFPTARDNFVAASSFGAKFQGTALFEIDDGHKSTCCIPYKIEEAMAKSKKSAKRKASDQRKAAKRKQSLSK
jgi:hypothetical protein